MPRLVWMLLAMEDRESIVDYIAEDSSLSAYAVDDRIQEQAEDLEHFADWAGKVAFAERESWSSSERLTSSRIELLRMK